MSAGRIFDRLVSAGMTETGAVAMLCNMQAESGLKASIAQRGQTRLTDEQYTQAADSDAIDFVRDGVGYGLCQWTYFSRKAGLLSWAKEHGSSVGAEAMQVDFCIHELKTDFPALWDFLCRTDELYTAVSRVCGEYERPAVNNADARYSYRTMFEGLSLCGSSPDTDPRYGAELAVLCRGFYGEQVSLLQRLIGAPDTGVYDRATEAAVLEFQKENGLTADGIAGSQTWKKAKERIA